MTSTLKYVNKFAFVLIIECFSFPDLAHKTTQERERYIGELNKKVDRPGQQLRGLAGTITLKVGSSDSEIDIILFS